MSAFFELTRAYFRSFIREPSAVIFSFAIPVLFIVIFGLFFGGQGTPHYDIGVALEQAGPNGQQLVSSLEQVSIFKIHQGTQQSELKKLGNGNRDAVVVVPASVEQPVQAGAPTPITVYADPSNSATQQIVLPVLRQTIDAVDRQLSGVPARFSLVTRSTSVQNVRYIDFLVPGILAMSLMQLGLYSAVTLVVQRETRLLRRLGATPLPRQTVIASQVVQRVIISVLQTAVLIAVGHVFFGVGFTHNLPMLTLFILLGTLAFVAMGFIIGSAAATQETAMPLVQFISLPMLFLSGIFFEVQQGPGFLEPIARALPLTYLADALRQSTVHATALNPLWVDGLVLCGWLIASFLVSVRLFRWE